MKPVSVCEIVARYGEILYRKGSRSRSCVMFLAIRCHRILGIRELSFVF
jgi:hypothetical protein